MKYQFQELVENGKKGKTEALERLIRELKPLILASIRRYDPRYHEDLYQEACLIIIQCVRDYDPQMNIPFLAYVKKIIYFSIFNIMRKRKELYSLDQEVGGEEGCTLLDFLEDEGSGTEELFIEDEENKALYDVVSRLSEKQRDVIELHYFKGYSLKSISQIKGVHYKTILRLKSRALDNLKKMLGDKAPF